MANLHLVEETKICKTCNEYLPLSYFTVNNASIDKLQRHCKNCDNLRQQKRRVEKREDISKYGKEYRLRKINDFKFRIKGLLNASRQRSLLKNREHTLTMEQLIDIYPKDNKCPIFGFELKWNNAGFRETSPSIDRIDSSKGYTIDNVQIISWKANRIKSYATIEDLEIVIAYMKSGG